MNTSNNIVYAGSGLLSRVFLVLFMALGCSSLSANFALVTDFQSGQGSVQWQQRSFGTGTIGIEADPINVGSNMVLSVNAGTAANNWANVFIPITPIANGDSGTIFFRFATEEFMAKGISGYLAGASPLLVGSVTDDTNYDFNFNKVHLNVDNNSAGVSANGGLGYRNLAGNGNVTIATNRDPLTWYSAWMVIDNAADTSSFYIQGGEWAVQTQLVTNHAFRSGVTGDDINSFLVGINGVQNGNYLLDDLYIDNTGSNLINPVPEPSVYAAVLGLLALGAVGMRRRRK